MIYWYVWLIGWFIALQLFDTIKVISSAVS